VNTSRRIADMERSPRRGPRGNTELPRPRWPDHPVSVIVDIPESKFQYSPEVLQELLQNIFAPRYDRFGPLDHSDSQVSREGWFKLTLGFPRFSCFHQEVRYHAFTSQSVKSHVSSLSGV